MSDYDDIILRVTREFAAGLPERLAVLREALVELANGYDPGAAERFYLQAHALHGTGASLGASVVAASARMTSKAMRRMRIASRCRGGGSERVARIVA